MIHALRGFDEDSAQHIGRDPSMRTSHPVRDAASPAGFYVLLAGTLAGSLTLRMLE